MSEAVRTIESVGNDFLLAGDPDDPYFQELEGYSIRDSALAKYLADNLPPDAICFDVGANIGITMVLMARLCPQGHVYAFEPGRENAKWLRRNVKLNDISNCTVVECAVGSTVGTLRFNEDRAWGFPSDNPDIPASMVSVTTLDEFVQVNPRIDRVDFIKIDVEGFEPHVLGGSRNLQRRFRPPVWMEFNAWTLLTTTETNPLSFASALLKHMRLDMVENDGSLVQATTAHLFLHRHLLQRGAVEDVLLRLKENCDVPSLAEMIGSSRKASQLRVEVDALRRSTSWRLTAPLRALKSAFPKLGR